MYSKRSAGPKSTGHYEKKRDISYPDHLDHPAVIKDLDAADSGRDMSHQGRRVTTWGRYEKGRGRRAAWEWMDRVHMTVFPKPFLYRDMSDNSRFPLSRIHHLGLEHFV